MQNPTSFDDQHAWGGQDFQNESQQDMNEYEDPTVVPNAHQDMRFRPFSQADFVASNSDDLFHPIPGFPS